MRVRFRSIGLLVLASASISTLVSAAPGDKLEGAKSLATIAPDVGFIDSPLAIDSLGKQLVFIKTDAAGRSTAVVRELASNASREVSLAGLKAVPTVATAVADGALFVVGTDARGREIAALFAGDSGKLTRRFGPATRVRLASYEGRAVVSIYDKRAKGKYTTHTASARDLRTGKRVGKRTSLRLDTNGRDKKRGFTVQYWLEENLAAVGIKEGTYSRAADQRMPDTAGRLDMLSGRIEETEIKDLIAHRKRVEALRQHSNEGRFLRFSRDRKVLNVFRDGTAREIKLAESISHYDQSSLVYHRGEDGSLFFTIRIDPVHEDAAKARRAVPDWIDLYQLSSGDAVAKRRARLRPKRNVPFSWIASASHWVLLPRHVGFSRGGPHLEILALEPLQPISKNN